MLYFYRMHYNVSIQCSVYTVGSATLQSRFSRGRMVTVLNGSFLKNLYCLECTVGSAARSIPFKLLSTVYMHNPDDKHPTRPGFELRLSQFRTTIALNETSRSFFQQINTIHQPNAGPMLVQRRRRWTNIGPALG